MIGPDLRSSAFQVLSALAVPENRSARGNMAPVAKAFHNQRPQAIAATGFPQPAATGHRNSKARKRRKDWQSQKSATETDAVIGTLEMAWEIRTAEAFRTSELIMVDEAAQTTEPMTLIPLQLAAADAHLILSLIHI